MLKLTLDFEILTPLYLGDGDGKQAELRPPSFKGLLRFWYRAADPEFRKHESDFFGGAGTGKGQSAVWLLIDEKSAPKVKWENFNADRFNHGSGKNRRNGLVYLGFPLQLGEGKDREAISPGYSFTLTLLAPRSLGEKMTRFRRAVAASCWLLAHFGSMGSRARRGFGVLSLLNWTIEGEWPEIDELPLVSQATSVEKARAILERSLAKINDWFGKWNESKKNSSPHHPHLGNKFEHKLVGQAFQDWAKALDDMGYKMQDFRNRRTPDYQQIKEELTGVRPLNQAPERVSFGMPLTFRFSSIRDKRAMLLPWAGEGQRQGSLLFLRLLKIGDRLHPHYVRMDGDEPGFTPHAMLRGGRRALRQPTNNAMDEFFDNIQTESR